MLTRCVVGPIAFLPSLASADDDEKPPGQSVFISPGGTVAFGLTVPDSGSDVFFNLRVKESHSWGAVGLGSDDMKGALYLMIYKNEKGDGVTFSPRLAYGNYEPTEYKDLEIETLNGTGISDGYMSIVARCKNHCRSWRGNGLDGKGWLDVNSPNQDCIYAAGPKDSLYSDKRDASLKFHQEFGVFSIDIASTRGKADPPILTKETEAEGSELKYKRHREWDVKSTMHATLMCLAVLILFPLGVVILRLGRWARWHGLNQGAALIILLAGFGMGIATSFHYRRVSSLFYTGAQVGRYKFHSLLTILFSPGTSTRTISCLAMSSLLSFLVNLAWALCTTRNLSRPICLLNGARFICGWVASFCFWPLLTSSCKSIVGLRLLQQLTLLLGALDSL